MRSTARLAATVAVALVAATGAAEAQKKNDDAMAKAQKHYQAAVALEEVGKYAEAADEYLAAHALFPNPEFYYLAANVYRLDGQMVNAVDYYERYLAEEPDGRASDDAREKLSALKEKLASEPDDTEPDDTEPDDTEPDDTEPDDQVDLDPTPPPGGSSGKGLTYGGIATAGVGLVAVGVGLKFGLDAKDYSDRASDVNDQWSEENLDLIDKGEAAEKKAIAFTVIGAAAVVGGGVMFVLGQMGGTSSGESRERRGVSITPTGGRGQAGVSVLGRF